MNYNLTFFPFPHFSFVFFFLFKMTVMDWTHNNNNNITWDLQVFFSSNNIFLKHNPRIIAVLQFFLGFFFFSRFRSLSAKRLSDHYSAVAGRLRIVRRTSIIELFILLVVSRCIGCRRKKKKYVQMTIVNFTPQWPRTDRTVKRHRRPNRIESRTATSIVRVARGRS